MENTYRRERQERKRRELQRKRNRQRLMIVGVFALVVGCILGSFIGGLGKGTLKEEVKTLTKQLDEKTKEVAAMQEGVEIQQNEGDGEGEAETGDFPWNLVLVNPWNEMEEGYEPELVEVEPDMEVDSRIADALKQMLADAKAEGLSPFICSAYRSVERQEQLFNNNMEKRLNEGLGYYDAYEKASTIVAVPGTSEHALGLAVDIVSVDYTTLDSGQEDTDVQKWLMENCYKYGFILRYPNGTTDITGIIYEPWHYRYVGEEVAAEIQQLGVTLEEYLEDHYQK